MKETLTAFIGVVLVSTVFLIISPDGKTKPTVKWIFSVFITVLVLSSVYNVFNGKKDAFETYVEPERYQTEYLTYTAEKRVENDKAVFYELLKSDGIEGLTLEPEYTIKNGEIEYVFVAVYVQNPDIISDKSHKDKIMKALSCVYKETEFRIYE